MRVLYLEPFHGGSHKDFADGLRRNSVHSIDLLSLPARFWKWRMRGAALHFVRSIDSNVSYDVVFATDLMSVADLRALWPGDAPPIVLYMHENQLSYPVPNGERMDLHFGFTDITSTLAADAVVFNSRFHRDTFFGELPGFLRRLPEYRPTWVVEEIERKSRVLYPGCRFPAAASDGGSPAHDRTTQVDLPRRIEPASREDRFPLSRSTGFRNDPPRVLWNHRWEFDKRPEAFFDALRSARRRGAEFDLVILGENFQAKPQSFLDARAELGSSILQFGFVESRDEYLRWVESCDVVVSTAGQENFGISVMEAMRYGCLPLLPRRLAYPELIPPELHTQVLYDTDDELADRLSDLLLGRVGASEIERVREEVRSVAGSFAWERRIDEFDRLITEAGRRESEALR